MALLMFNFETSKGHVFNNHLSEASTFGKQNLLRLKNVQTKYIVDPDQTASDQLTKGSLTVVTGNHSVLLPMI